MRKALDLLGSFLFVAFWAGAFWAAIWLSFGPIAGLAAVVLWPWPVLWWANRYG